MPANLPPQYYEAEKEFRAARTVEEKIMALEEMIAIMPKHKGTDHLKAELRAKIAKLNQSMGKKAATRRASLVIEKEGAAQIPAVGLPNSGKSQLISRLTGVPLMVADYPFTTRSAAPAMMTFENIKVQLIDTPPLAPYAIEFWMPHLLRRADALLLVVDLGLPAVEQVTEIAGYLERMRVVVAGLSKPADEGFVTEKRALVVGNKLDLPESGQVLKELQDTYRVPVVAVSARDGTGLEDLRRGIFELADIIRVYTKVPGKKADMTDPMVVPRGSTLEEAAAGVHKDFAARMKYARLWGSGKHDGITVSRDHVLQDGDILELHL